MLPWLLKKSTYTAFGGFGGGTQSSFYVKHWGFWRALDAWNVVVLDVEHVLVDREGSYAVLARGSLRAQLVCEKRMSLSVSLPPGPAAVDCVDAGAHEDGITGLAWRRFDARGRKLDERTVFVVGDGRIFPQPRVFAYDDAGVPYFLTMSREAAADYRIQPRDCALVSNRNNDPPLVGPAELSWDECNRPATWEKVAGRRLHEARMQRNGVFEP